MNGLYVMPESDLWTRAQHEAAAQALGYFSVLMMGVAQEASEDRLSVYLLVIRFAAQHAARHAGEALLA